MDKSGVYKLKCEDCGICYVGQTGRRFKDRVKEHRRSFIYNDGKSCFADHLCRNNHFSNFDINISHCCDKGLKLDFMEKFEIANSPDGLRNDVLFCNDSPLLKLSIPMTSKP